MRVLSQSELSRMSKGELSALLNRIACELPELKAGSPELNNAHINLQNIRRAVTPKPGFGPR